MHLFCSSPKTLLAHHADGLCEKENVFKVNSMDVYIAVIWEAPQV